MHVARRLDRLPGYAFADMDRLRDERVAAGADVIDFGVGDPTEPTPEGVVRAAEQSLCHQ
jgi:LL-diaminopimelate aminotransferase